MKYYLRYTARSNAFEIITAIDEVHVVSESATRIAVNHNGKTLLFKKSDLRAYGRDSYGELVPINEESMAEKRKYDAIVKSKNLVRSIRGDLYKLDKLPLDKLQQIHDIMKEVK